MSKSKFIKSLLATVSALGCVALPVAAQPVAVATTQAPGQTMVAVDNSINPMTGRTASEEELARQLAKSKLQTQIGQEQVKQAQNSADLALATLRQEAEKTRLRNETAVMAMNSGANSGSKIATKTGTSAPSPAQKAISVLESNQPAVLMQTAVPKPAAQPSSGSITFGYESIRLDAVPRATTAQVDWVDTQTRVKQVPGAPLQPLNVQPATGMLGVPPIPGMQSAPSYPR